MARRGIACSPALSRRDGRPGGRDPWVATYRDSGASTEARFEALLEDVTKPGSAVVIGARGSRSRPATSIRDHLPARRIIRRMRYAVARASRSATKLYVSEQPVTVLTRGSGNTASLTLNTYR
jgi:hypothetical protein